MRITLRIGTAGTATAGLAALFALLLAATDAAAGAAAGPLRVWNCDIHDATDSEQGTAPPAISITGARNGSFSGKVVVGGGPVQGLKATLGALKQGAAAIPASGMLIRYGVLWDQSIGSFMRPPGRDILMESLPPDFSAEKVPVWVTVKAPQDAQPGAYTGVLVVEAKGLSPVSVPVKLDVQDWTLPDPQDYRTWIELIEQPDTLALEYNVPLWSDKHWEMITKSFQLIADTGSRVACVPLICGTNYGNAETMVRWIKKGENKYEYDYAIMDKYLDLFEKHAGKPKIVIFYAWDTFMCPSQKWEEKSPLPVLKDGEVGDGPALVARAQLKDKGPPVTVLDPATGKTETVNLPKYTDPAAKTLWKPLFDELHKRMAKRGLEKNMMVGMLSDYQPAPDEAKFYAEVTGNLPWTSTSHHFHGVLEGKSLGKLHETADVGYAAVALDFQFSINPAKERSYGWKKPILHGIYWRFGYFNTMPLSAIRNEAECNITGFQRGISHLGADFWPCLKSKSGKRQGSVTDRYPQSYWHSLNIGSYMLGPGPNGPAGTSRLEVLREGVQECEARIAIESVLTDEAQKAKLGAELAKRAQDFLDGRQFDLWRARGATDDDLQIGIVKEYRKYIFELTKKWSGSHGGYGAGGQKWFLASNWPERSGKLFALAAEVAKKLGGK